MPHARKPRSHPEAVVLELPVGTSLKLPFSSGGWWSVSRIDWIGILGGRGWLVTGRGRNALKLELLDQAKFNEFFVGKLTKEIKRK